MIADSPVTFVLFRILIVLLAAIPLTIFVLALFGYGPLEELLEPLLSLFKDWFHSQTGLDIP